MDAGSWKEQLSEFLRMYSDEIADATTMNAELDVWYVKFAKKKESRKVDLLEAYKEAAESRIFPSIVFLLKLLLTVPVTNASTERANSTLKFIKTSLRSTMSQSSLNAFVLGYKHRAKLANMSGQSIAQHFAAKKRRRLLLMHPLNE